MPGRYLIHAALRATLAAGAFAGPALAHDLVLDPALPPHAHEEIRLALQHDPNFAETAVFARWGCGTGCTQCAVSTGIAITKGPSHDP